MGKKFTSDHPDISEIIRRKKPNEKQVEILLEPVLKSAIEEKEKEVDRAMRLERSGRKSIDQKAASTLQEELDAMLEEARENSVIFHFRDIGRKNLDQLVLKYPPTEEQKALWKAEGNQGTLGYNLETFPPALIAACCIDPVMTYEEAVTICEEWGGGDIETLFYAGAMAACKERTSIPLSRLVTEEKNSSPLSSTSVSAMDGTSDTASS